MISSTCCFSGHRRLPENQIDNIIYRLNEEVDLLIKNGFTHFISGGAIGFDLLAASFILTKKEMGCPIRLIFAFPCRNHDDTWTLEQKRFLHQLIQNADETVYVSDEYNADCMKHRNHYMVDRSSVCLCAMLYARSGTGQTVRYAIQNNRKVVNIAKEKATV